MIKAIYDWSMGAKWRTWLCHGLLALGLSFLVGGWAAAVFYFLREVEQNALKLWAEGDFEGDDAVMDALIPMLVGGGYEFVRWWL